MTSDLNGFVKISCDYPGGNVKVHGISTGCADVDADLRDTPSNWFYWNFEAEAVTPGTVRFQFPVGRWMISRQGPAVSTDEGKTWRWLGRENTTFNGSESKVNTRDSFDWTFTRAGEKVRFAQGIPYLLKDFEEYYSTVRNSPYLKRSVLTISRQGRELPLLTIGNGPENMLLTARHHCCEAMASYALEGFVAEALSDSPAAVEFRSRYTLYVVPFMDLDGAEAGDQGKNRAPHDQNRDYGLVNPIYPENKAVMALHAEKKFKLVLDLHDPAVRYDAHEMLYFGGFSTPSNRANTREFKAWVDEELPEEINPILYRHPEKDNIPPVTLPIAGDMGIPSSLYFTIVPDIVYGTTVEIPYATVNGRYNEKSSRKIGQAFLRAVLKTDFRKDGEPRTGYKEYLTFCATAGAADMERNDIPEHYRIAAMLNVAEKTADLALCEKVMASPVAMTQQKYRAAGIKTAILAGTPDLAPWIEEMKQRDLLATPAVRALTPELASNLNEFSREIYNIIPKEPGTYEENETVSDKSVVDGGRTAFRS